MDRIGTLDQRLFKSNSLTAFSTLLSSSYVHCLACLSVSGLEYLNRSYKHVQLHVFTYVKQWIGSRIKFFLWDIESKINHTLLTDRMEWIYQKKSSRHNPKSPASCELYLQQPST
jgi:hypothetical protein